MLFLTISQAGNGQILASGNCQGIPDCLVAFSEYLGDMSIRLHWVNCPVCGKPYLPPESPTIDDYACRDCNEKAKTADATWLALFKAKRQHPSMSQRCKSPDGS
jgi:hypothetical protein